MQIQGETITKNRKKEYLWQNNEPGTKHLEGKKKSVFYKKHSVCKTKSISYKAPLVLHILGRSDSSSLWPDTTRFGSLIFWSQNTELAARIRINLQRAQMHISKLCNYTISKCRFGKSSEDPRHSIKPNETPSIQPSGHPTTRSIICYTTRTSKKQLCIERLRKLGFRHALPSNLSHTFLHTKRPHNWPWNDWITPSIRVSWSLLRRAYITTNHIVHRTKLQLRPYSQRTKKINQSRPRPKTHRIPGPKAKDGRAHHSSSEGKPNSSQCGQMKPQRQT